MPTLTEIMTLIDWLLKSGFPTMLLIALTVVFYLYVRSQNERIERLEKEIDSLRKTLGKTQGEAPPKP